MTSNQDDCKQHEEDINKLKFRNEIEAFARLKGLGSISGLYDNSIDDKVSASLGEVYHEGPNLSLETPGNMFSSLVNKSDNVDKQPDNNLIMKLECPTVDDIIKEGNHISRDAYFMNVAILTAKRSSDDNTQVGAVLVLHNKIIGTGYNGIPKGLDKSLFPTCRDGELHESKYGYVVHAEANTLCNTTVFDLTGSKLYCTLYPCCECAKLLIQKGISEVIYLSDKHHDDPPYIASRKLFKAAGVTVRQYNDRLLLT